MGSEGKRGKERSGGDKFGVEFEFVEEEGVGQFDMFDLDMIHIFLFIICCIL